MPPHNFRYTTTSSYWSVLAMRPPLSANPVADYDLKVFGSESMSGNPVGASAAGGSAADFVVIDSNAGKQPVGTYYPQTYRYSGSVGAGVQP